MTTRRLVPPLNVVLAVAGMALVVGGFIVHGLAAADAADQPTRGPATGTDSVVVAANGTAQQRTVPAHTVVLVIDGPLDPTTTPAVLAALDRAGATATFAVGWGDAARRPGLVRAVLAAGQEVALRADTDHDRTLAQLALAGATGRTTDLVASTAPGDAVAAALALADDQFVSVALDPAVGDLRPTVDALVSAGTPDGRPVQLTLDAGSGNSPEDLSGAVGHLRAAGFEVGTLGAALDLDVRDYPAVTTDVVAGRILIAAVTVSAVGFEVLEDILVVFSILMAARMLVTVVVARQHVRATRAAAAGRPTVTEPATVVVPAYNEKECIEATVRSLLASTHPIEIIVVDDGSDDGTADIVASLALPEVHLIRQRNGGKPSALNAGIAAARHDLVVLLDGDTVFEPTTVQRLVQPFADPAVGAVAGNTKVANRHGIITGWQHLEYVIGFNLDRRLQDRWRCMATIPGAVGAFRTRALRDVGGIADDTLAEDTDVTIALVRAGWRVVYEGSARAWTEAPATLHQLWLQRYRWSYGTMQAMWKHRASLTDRGPSGHFGRVGLLMLLLFGVLMPLVGPVADVYLVYVLLDDPTFTLAVLIGSQLVQLGCASYAFRLDGERQRGLWVMPLQQLVYRQLMYAVVIRSVVSAVSGVRLGWQKLRRVGDFTAAES